MAARIEDYGLIGNMNTAALVSRAGSIDWFCTPRFDSDACMASLLGYDEHGRWSLRPVAPVRESRQRYLGDTLVLETEFTCDGGVVRISDFMPVGTPSSTVMRSIEGVEGEVPMEMVLDVRFGYGSEIPWISMDEIGSDGHAVRFTAGPNALALHSPFALTASDGRTHAIANVKKGQRLSLELTWYPSHERCPAALDVDGELEKTRSFWQDWAGRCTQGGVSSSCAHS
jgi:GH15 family glucan-1,4-alpha-glucosidase